MKTYEFYSIYTDVCPLGSNYQYSSIDSDDGLAQTRHQAIIWINGGYINGT